MIAMTIRINCPTEASAREIAQTLLDKRLIACGNLWPIRSLYRWKGAVEDETEATLLVKTRADLFDRVAQETRRLHPYETPCVIGARIDAADPEYLAWIFAETEDPA